MDTIDEMESSEYRKFLDLQKWVEEVFGLNTKADIPTDMLSEINANTLQTTLVSDDYEVVLNRLYLTKENIVQEIGTNALYIVLGFLEWQEEPTTKKKLSAPLLVAPVRLTRRTGNNHAVRYQFSIAIEDEFVINKTLKKKLHDNFLIDLPDFVAGMTVEEYFDSVRDVVAEAGKYWRIKRQVYLTILDFTKLAMYEDLEPSKWLDNSLLDNKNIQTLILGTDKEQSSVQTVNIDQLKNFDRNVPLILDADNSQSTAIVEVLAGKNLVIEGPPGTGKSQTITNLIAALLNEGKTVLFASEKLAALKVVKSKLDVLGLGDFCLELHSDQVDKQSLRKSLKKRMQLHPTRLSSREIEQEYQNYEVLKSSLNDYIDAVNEQEGKINRKNGEVLLSAGRYKQAFPKGELLRPDEFNLENCEELLSYERLGRVRDLTNVAQRLLKNSQVNKLDEHLWYGVGLSTNTSVDFQDAIQALQTWTSKLQEVDQVIHKALQTFFLKDRKKENWVQLFNRLTCLPNLDENPYLIDLPWLLRIDQNKLVALLNNFKTIYSSQLDLQKELPSICFSPSATIKFEQEVVQISKLLREDLSIRECISVVEQEPLLRSKFSEVKEVLEKLLRECGLQELSGKLSSKNFLILIAGLIEKARDVRGLVSHCDIGQFLYEIRHFDFDLFKSKLAELKAKKEQLQNYFDLSLHISSDELEKINYVLKNGSILSWFNSDWRKARSELKKVLKVGIDFQEGISKIPLWVEYKKKESDFATNEQYCCILGSLFKGVDTDLSKIRSVLEWCRIIDNYKKAETALGIRREILKIASFSEIELEAFCDLQRLDLASHVRSILRLFDSLQVVFNETAKKALNDDVVQLCDQLGALDRELKKCSDLFNFDLKKGVSDFRNSLCQLHQNFDCFASWRENSLWSFLPEDHFGLTLESSQSEISEKMESLEQIMLATSVINGVDADDIYKFLVSQPQEYPQLVRYILDNEPLLQKEQELSEIFYKVADVSPSIWEKRPGLTSHGCLSRNKEALSSQETLIDWLDFVQEIQKANKLNLKKITWMIQKEELLIKDLGNAYNSMAYGFLAEKILSKHPVLENLTDTSHDELQADFIEADRDLKKFHVKEIFSNLTQTPVPEGKSAGKVRDLTDRRLLEHEINKVKRLLSNRELLSRAWGAIIALKPCFMMSPLSVAQYLKAGEHEFDVVVMDEASQIKPEDAIGVIARGKQVVIVGDPQQLPPTNFFQNATGNDEDQDDNTIIDESESILDAAWNYFDRCTLNWHYRSRHQSLIEFSNHYFYNDRLTVFPSPFADNKNYGVKFHYLKNGTFDKNNTNKEEAYRIALAVAKHLREHNDESFGVVAMNAAQSECIRNEIEVLAAQDIELRLLLDANAQNELPWFVKNLENVQGDERDVIFISLTYGPATKGGRVAQRFGPITHEKGGRRLNVLFSRARKRMEVFSSMKSSDVLASTGRGTGILHDFLEYCTTRMIPQSVDVEARPADSDFEIAVTEALRQKGYRCVPQVGVRGYFIDIGVVDPRDPNKFILGIECDGASYHSSTSARERDRLRQEVLEGLGWKILRVWSTDWFRNPASILSYISSEIEEILEDEPYLPDDESRNDEEPMYEDSVEIDDGSPFNQQDGIRRGLEVLSTEILNNFPDTDPSHRLLRENMINYFVAEKPISVEEFHETCPRNLRIATSAEEASKYLVRVFQTIAKYN